MLGITLFGIIAYRSMPVSDLPTVDFPTINVGCNLPGADPDTMASAVASALERQFTGISGLDSMTSSSSPDHQYHSAVLPGPRYRRRRGGRTDALSPR